MIKKISIKLSIMNKILITLLALAGLMFYAGCSSQPAPVSGGTSAAVVCGDGIVVGTEACDDGNTVTETACAYGTANCTACDAICATVLNLTGSTCGDTVCDVVENNTSCPADCTIATCGNGACDVATETNANCPADCTVCGDGIVAGTETCDDGNTVTETACAYGTATCTTCNATCGVVLNLTGSFCGDGACNTGNGETLASCSADCTPAAAIAATGTAADCPTNASINVTGRTTSQPGNFSHNAGQDCMQAACHVGNNVAATALWKVAGTIYMSAVSTMPAGNRQVLVVDGLNNNLFIQTDDCGNFYDSAMTFTPAPGNGAYSAFTTDSNQVINGTMNQALNATSDGSCNSCHGISQSKLW